MIEIQGQFNTAVCYTPALDAVTEGQIRAVCDQEAFKDSKIRIMPDVHAGMGCTIGTTMTITDKVVPGMVGVDIGCGMETVRLAEKEIDFAALDALIRKEIPCGRDIRKTEHQYNEEINLYELRCAPYVSIERAKRSIGTLGGGNHFIEVDRGENGDLYLVVHSGSRHLGTQVCKYYQDQGRFAMWGGARHQIDELIARFLEVDLVGIRAQTHASLTACRGLIRYAEITGDETLVEEARKRWDLYLAEGMTAAYQNYNWFCRYDTWSEPCAVVDSYMLAVQLWQHTGDPGYLDQAELIYYNGICHSQRAGGGFGCDFCPSVKTGRQDLAVRTDEASWCCTMRGAEGLSSAASYAFFRQGKSLILPFYRDCSLDLDGLQIREESNYPFDPEHGEIRLTVERGSGAYSALCLREPLGGQDYVLEINGKEVPAQFEGKFLRIRRPLRTGDTICLRFKLAPASGGDRIGPLLYGTTPDGERRSVYHLMDPEVCRDSGYSLRVLD